MSLLRAASVRSSAWPLTAAFVLMVVYASLYPFVGWRLQGLAPLAFLLAPMPQYWTWFDVLANWIGYMPLGFLLGLALTRSGSGRSAFWLAWLSATGLSLAIETAQGFLPTRVPSNLDLALNSAGAAFGAAGVSVLMRFGGLRWWAEFRESWFQPQTHAALVLLALWPFALLYPASIPFGLGQFWDRLDGVFVAWLSDTPFLSWWPVRAPLQALLGSGFEAVCVALSLLAPVCLGFAEIRSRRRRFWLLVWLLGIGLAVEALSAALTYSPRNAWAWFNPQAGVGMALAVLLALLFLRAGPNLCRWGVLIALVASLWLLNRSQASPYFAQSLALWEQGRFIRFHGLIQWLGWLWPIATLWVVLRHLLANARRAASVPP